MATPESSTTKPLHSLPYAVVDLLFGKLGVRYGHLFLGRWSGIDLEAVKEDWRVQLAGCTPEQLDFAVENLPEQPPENVTVFRKLARSMPTERRAALAPPTGPVHVPSTVREAFEKLAAPQADDEPPAHVRVARSFIARWSAPGARPTPEQHTWLHHYQRVVARWDAEQVRIAQARAKAAQQTEPQPAASAA